ncbi:D-alanine--D-alanine ligase [bacterium]|nr:MAG: D-alanine--D-alanine ligase [bacterium]
MTSVIVLGGGPDAEREVSIKSATAIHQACIEAGLDARLEIVDRPTLDEIQSWDCDVVFPALHGRFGEGGELQVLLEQAKIAFVGSKAIASQLAMDKMGTKRIAIKCSIPTPDAVIFDHGDGHSDGSVCPLVLPVVIKPVSDGSSVGLHLCFDQQDWDRASAAVREDAKTNPNRVYMVEQMIQGRELTASVLCDDAGKLQALALIEICPAQGVYDFEAKYARKDTIYTLNPDLPDETVAGIQEQALRLCNTLGVRHLARVDFLLSDDGQWTLLELNTMPGFTRTSLMPMAAGESGMGLAQLCAHLVHCARNEHDISPSVSTS